jgi:hypothetical protein
VAPGDFKSLASTSSATSASLILHNFLPLSVQLVSKKSFDVSKTCSLAVLDPVEGPGDRYFILDATGVVRPHP